MFPLIHQTEQEVCPISGRPRKWVRWPFRRDHAVALNNTGKKYGRIEISKQALNFSIAHFTIFSRTNRENLHGHNFQVECELTAPIGDNGLIFDYSIIKRLIRELCEEIDELVILPEQSPYLSLEEDEDYLVAVFDGQRMPFLRRDVKTLPIANTSVEELAHYFLSRTLKHPALKDHEIVELTIKISSSPGQKGAATWKAQ